MIDFVLSSDDHVPPGFAPFAENFGEDVLLRGGRSFVRSAAIVRLGWYLRWHFRVLAAAEPLVVDESSHFYFRLALNLPGPAASINVRPDLRQGTPLQHRDLRQEEFSN